MSKMKKACKKTTNHKLECYFFWKKIQKKKNLNGEKEPKNKSKLLKNITYKALNWNWV